MPGWDYRDAGAYYITLVTAERAAVFGDVIDSKVALSAFGRLAVEELQRTSEVRPDVKLDEHVVMPNHVHAILWLDGQTVDSHLDPLRTFGGSQGRSLGTVVGGFKASVTSLARQVGWPAKRPLWQRNYYEHVIRSREELERLRRYIIENPTRWLEDEENPARG